MWNTWWIVETTESKEDNPTLLGKVYIYLLAAICNHDCNEGPINIPNNRHSSNSTFTCRTFSTKCYNHLKLRILKVLTSTMENPVLYK